jgi:hypothetical protein
MGETFSIVATLIALGFFAYMVYVLRTNLVRGGFVGLWMIIGGGLLSIPLAESFYIDLAGFMGLARAADMIFVLVIGFCLAYMFLLTVKLQKTADAVESLVSRLAVLEAELASERRRVTEPRDESLPSSMDARG